MEAELVVFQVAIISIFNVYLQKRFWKIEFQKLVQCNLAISISTGSQWIVHAGLHHHHNHNHNHNHHAWSTFLIAAGSLTFSSISSMFQLFTTLFFLWTFDSQSSAFPTVVGSRTILRAIKGGADQPGCVVDLNATNFDALFKETPATHAVVEFFAHWSVFFLMISRVYEFRDYFGRGFVPAFMLAWDLAFFFYCGVGFHCHFRFPYNGYWKKKQR